jgi:hypothetical protein
MSNKVVKKDPITQRESFSELLGQLAANSAAVVHDEIELAIQGIREKARAVSGGILTAAIGAVVGFAAFLCLCAALIIGLTSYLGLFNAALVVGVSLALIGVVVVFIGYRQLKKTTRKI